MAKEAAITWKFKDTIRWYKEVTLISLGKLDF
jgi:hypothetical protein